MIPVIDASSLAAYLLNEEETEHIGKTLREGVASTDLVELESCNAILNANARGAITGPQADRALAELLILAETNMEMLPQRELLKESFEVARANSLTVYDAIYITLAKVLGTILISRDGKQIEVAKKLGVKVGKG